jgi:flagellar biogenesis protein FliO
MADDAKHSVPAINTPPPIVSSLATSREGAEQSVSKRAPDASTKVGAKRNQTQNKPVAYRRAQPSAHKAITVKRVAAPVRHAIAKKPTPAPVHKAVAASKPALAPTHKAVAAKKPTPAPVYKAVAAKKPAPAPVHKAVATAKPSPAPVHKAVATAKPSPAPVHKAVAVSKPAPAPVHKAVAASKPAPAASVESLTKDGSQSAAPVIQQTQNFNPLVQIGRMFASLLVVLGLIVVAVKFLKKNQAFVERFRGVGKQPKTAENALETLPASAIPINMLMKQSNGSLPANIQIPPGLVSGLDIVSTQTLAGSGSVIYLVKAADRMMLLGASAQGGVRTLAEWDVEDQRPAAEVNASFDAFLQSQENANPNSNITEAEFSFVRLRLHEVASRIAKRTRENILTDNSDGKTVR